MSDGEEALERPGTREAAAGGRQEVMPAADEAIDYGGVADLYDHYVRFDEDIPFYLEACRGIDGPILELMAGTGRVSIALVESGAYLTCVDRSAPMLAILEAKLRERGLHAAVLHCDVRDLDLPPRFALALMPFHSFAELLEARDRERALAAIRRCLRPGGEFICAIHNPEVRRKSIRPELRTLWRSPLADGGEVALKASGRHDEETGLVEGVQVVQLLDAGGRVREERVIPVRFILLDMVEFEGLARRAGFEVVSLYGDYARNAFDPSTSPYMIWVLRRPAAAPSGP